MSLRTPRDPLAASDGGQIRSRPWFGVAGGLGLGMLFLVACLATVLPAAENFVSRLTDVGQDPTDAVRIWLRNLPFLAASALFALGLARTLDAASGTRPSRRRLVIATVVVATVMRQAVVLGAQLASLAAQVGRPAWVVLLAMPHGLIEFTGVFLPFGALVDGLGRSADAERQRRIVLASVVGAAVLLLAATVEALFTPHVLHALQAAAWAQPAR